MSETNIDIERLYNSELKKEYFDTQLTAESTKVTTYFDFLNITKVEKDSNKDAYAFNDLEIATVLRVMESSSILSIRRLLSNLNDYVEWCIDNGKRGNDETYINNVQQFISTEINLSKYVSNKQASGKVLSEDEFEDLLNILINPIDVALILCMYNLIGGSELYEIRSLTYESIDEYSAELSLVGKDGSVRRQRVEDRLIDELLLLSKTKTYRANNGNPDQFGRVNDMPFADSKYLFRPTQPNATGEIMSPSTIYTRLRQIKQVTGYNYISPTSLRDTRLVHEVLREMSKREEAIPTNKIVNDVLDNISNTYGVKFSHMQRYSLTERISKLVEIGVFN